MAAAVSVTFVSLLIFVVAAVAVAAAASKIIELDEDNWREVLRDEWMVEFYAPWCPACKGLQPVWAEFAASTTRDLEGLKVGRVDVTASPGLSGRFMVTALPTIFHVLDGEFRRYKGTRDRASFVGFVAEKRWRSVDPVPSWKSPDTLQMSAVSAFFKLSQVLRGVHNRLMEEYGLPTWGSYLIFAVATIVLGALLGLVLVCLIDLVYPPSASSSKSAVAKRPDDKKSSSAEEEEEEEDDVEDLLDDEDIKDDLLDDAAHMDEHEHERGASGVTRRKARKAD